MPIRYQVDQDRSLAIVAGRDVIQDGELEAVSSRMEADPQLAACGLEIHDWRAVVRNELSADCLRHVAKTWSALDSSRETTRMAMLVARDVEFGLTRMYATLRDGAPFEIETFRSVTEAEQWLALPEGYVDERVAAVLASHEN